jgi:acetyl-CoA decarbonylase/synthase complex subunit gamma
MPIKGTDVVKRLPEAGKKNCKECGFPTCFAFAMKLASGGATLDKCPHLTAEVKAELEDALAPAIKLVTIGVGENAVKIGNEEVVYRHEKTYVHPTAVAILISDKEPDPVAEAKIKKAKQMQFERVGLKLRSDMIALHFESGDRSKYLGLVKKAADSAGKDVGIALICTDLDTLFAARDVCADLKPLLYPITKDNIEAAIPRVKQSPTPLGVKAASIAELVPLTTRLKAEKIDDLVLDPGSKNLMEGIRDQTLIRRAAVKQSFRPLGYPTIAFPCFMAKGGLKETLVASAFVIKFAAIAVLSDFDEHSLLPLLVQRLNIYTDPRMPLSVEEKIYDIGEPTEDSPVLITSNWALTYFIVSAEIEASKVASYLLVKDTEGLGTLTAWAAGKFNGDSIAPFVRKSGIEGRTKTRKLIIPGLTARIRGELGEALPGWEIVVGPREAGEIPAFLPKFAATLKN